MTLSNILKKIKSTNIIANFLNLSGIQISNILLLLIIFPVITRKIGLDNFGIVMFANRFTLLAGTIINYGTNQSGIRDIAAAGPDKNLLNTTSSKVFFVRLLVFAVFIILFLLFGLLNMRYYNYLLLALPMVVAELINPLFYFTGIEKLRIFNLTNLAGNFISVLVIVFLIKGPQNAPYVNFFLGWITILSYLFLILYTKKTEALKLYLPKKATLKLLLIENFYLTINNVSVQLQQSLMIFALARWGTVEVLGAYSVCDRIIGQCRNLIITISNSIYPNAVKVYQLGTLLWIRYRQKIKLLTALVMSFGALILFIFANPIVLLLTKKVDHLAVIYLKTMSVVPVIAALNFTNVIDQLLKNKTKNIFYIAVFLLLISAIAVFIILKSASYSFVGCFTLIVEASALFMYEYTIRKPVKT